MKYLKIAALFSLVNALFFGVFLYVLYSQNMILKSQDSVAPVVQEAAGTAPVATSSPNQAESPSVPKAKSQTVPEQDSPAAVKPNPAPAVQPASNRCIVTISGQKYDVTDFRTQHSGGDIFVCGTDMTRTFFGQHNQELLDSPKMASLKVK